MTLVQKLKFIGEDPNITIKNLENKKSGKHLCQDEDPVL